MGSSPYEDIASRERQEESEGTRPGWLRVLLSFAGDLSTIIIFGIPTDQIRTRYPYLLPIGGVQFR
jgi:hypothetical protein